MAEPVFLEEKRLVMGAGKPFPPQLPDPEDYVVEFDGPEDPTHPYNWNLMVKFRTSLHLFLSQLYRHPPNLKCSSANRRR